MTAYLLVNFGGPRSLAEIQPFLSSLLTDRDVIDTSLPNFLHQFLFRKIAKKRTYKVAADYASIGGKSPIYEDTEAIAQKLRNSLSGTVLTFHRYLPATHKQTLIHLNSLDVQEIHVFPMFPQFTYATTGSIARFFSRHLPKKTLNKMKWVKSYPNHPAFISAIQKGIRDFLYTHQLSEKESFFFFSAHGLPKKYVEQGDLYAYECRLSFERVMEGFPHTEALLAYQSKFGPGEWLRPYTIDRCDQIHQYCKGRKKIIFIPISFTSDHIETLFEIEQQYLPIIREKGLSPYRVPALNQREDWIEAIVAILKNFIPCSTTMLIKK